MIKKYHFYQIALVIIWAIGLVACGEGNLMDERPDEIEEVIPQRIINASLLGKILDEVGEPMVNATVNYLTGQEFVQTYTDDEGYFEITDFTNQGEAAYLKISYPGKFEAFRKVSLVENRTNYTEVIMLDRLIAGSVNAKDGGVVANDVGASVELPGGGIVTSNGLEYDGQVNVAMAWIDPTSIDLSSKMIGDLSGIDEDGVVRSLSSMGMLQIELIGEDESLLNLGEGHNATLTFPIPNSVLVHATPTIPLWSYDEEEGTWIEEGEAQLDGDTYIGEVNHFSSWNVDYKEDPIRVFGSIKWEVERTENQKVLVGGSFLQVYICGEPFGRVGGWLCEDGSFDFYNFPSGEKFQLKVIDDCNEVIYEETFGPFLEDEDLGVISVINGGRLISLSGNALNCNSEPVTNGHVFVSDGHIKDYYPIASDGTFEIGYHSCISDDLFIEIVDYDNAESSGVLVYPLESRFIQLEDVLVCEGLESFFIINIEDRNMVRQFTSGNVAWDATAYLEEDELSPDSIMIILSSGIAVSADPVITAESIAFGVILHKDFMNDETFDLSNVGIGGMFYVDATNAIECEYDIADLPTAEIVLSFSEFDLTPGGLVKGSFAGSADCELSSEIRSVENIVSGSFRLRFQ